MRHSIPNFAKFSKTPQTTSFHKSSHERQRPQKLAEVHQRFEYLIRKTEKLFSSNPTERNLILEDLNYFLRQSLTDSDRRHHTDILKNKWKAFDFKVHRTELLKEPRGFFHSIYEFVGLSQSIVDEKKEIEEMNKLELPDFFHQLLYELERKKSFMSKEEELLVFCGLKYLQSESKLPAMKLDRKAIGRVWRGIKPIMERYGFFYKYEGAKSLSSKLRLFITGSL